MAMSRAGGDDELNAEINVTPMVDVMLVLLIIFMITAPMMNTGVVLELPQVTAQNVEDPEGKLVLSIAKDDKIFLGGTQVHVEGARGQAQGQRARQEGERALHRGRYRAALRRASSPRWRSRRTPALRRS